MPFVLEDAIRLFYDHDLKELVEGQLGNVDLALFELSTEDVLNVPIDDHVEAIFVRWQVVLPSLREDLAHVEEPREATRKVILHGIQRQVDATRYTVRIPFWGHTGLFRHYPGIQSSTPPRATLNDRELALHLIGYGNVTAHELKDEIDKTISGIKQCLEQQRAGVEECNRLIRETARAKLEERKARILQSKSIAASLPYPLRPRGDAPQTYISSELRRTITPARAPSASPAQSFTPEPTIDEADYQHILKVIGDMAIMMERSPRTFAKLGEEEIRDHFLLQLNGHYEGSATGETFNAAGKTDILVRQDNRNLFIAECKIWDGRKTLLEAIDQLLDYLTWRDTKAAIVIFSRNKDFSAVLDVIKVEIEHHPNKKRGPQSEGETRFRYVFGRREDRNREIIVTIMAFSVPSQS
jgi:hypothetical protein